MLEASGTKYHQAMAHLNLYDIEDGGFLMFACLQVIFDAGNPTHTKLLFTSLYLPELGMGIVLPQQAPGMFTSVAV